MNEIQQAKIERYIMHLDTDGLRQAIRFIMCDETGKDTIIEMAELWDKSYPVQNYTGEDCESLY